ncbi:MAG: class I SAM-dependent RNA methyltransferase [Oscillospiraceae bacterium]|nr:class I SAM-dependent RNA methyltransferase [Oscillospiraceae bacterium]
MSKYTLICPCHFGLESVLSSEVKRIGGQDVAAADGRVSFGGDDEMLAKSNIWLRTAERVLIKLGEFEAVSFTELFDNVKEIHFEDYIGKNDAFPVKGWSINSRLQSVPACQSIIKKAIVERMKDHYKISRFAETGPIHAIQFSIHKNIVTVMLDTSGIGLHKRGYRKVSNLAPIKETLAAGLVDLAHVKRDSMVYDPFCGSGTIVIEAAMKAKNIAPGLKRSFLFEQWGIMDKNIVTETRMKALSSIIHDADFAGFGMDISQEAVNLSSINAKTAGVNSAVSFRKSEINDFTASEDIIVITNPPYGERMLEISLSEELYKVMGTRFSQAGCKAYVISPHEQFEKLYGTAAAKRRKLYNGMIKCQYYMYY